MTMTRALWCLLVGSAAALSPVATPGAWDAVSLGGPRVIGSEGAGYTMFYHYRPVADAENAELPPLSTGRVGRATSRDGFAWERQSDGLGAGGSVVSANTDDWYWFDSGHVGIGDVLYGGDAFFLYTFGGSTTPIPLRDFGVDRDGDCFGMDLKMGVCVSQDGVKFGRIEGDEADGSVLSPDPASWERDGGPVGWPTVCRAPGNAESGELLLYYGAAEKDSGSSAVGVASSKNGVLWTRVKTDAPVLAKGDPGAWDAGGVLRRTVLEQADGGYAMFYEAKDEANVHRIGRATSRDGVAWVKDDRANPVFGPAADDTHWDSGAVSSPCVVDVGGGKLRMYYAANAKGAAPMSFGVAESADGGATWDRVAQAS